jgi:hypothetical protein
MVFVTFSSIKFNTFLGTTKPVCFKNHQIWIWVLFCQEISVTSEQVTHVFFKIFIFHGQHFHKTNCIIVAWKVKVSALANKTMLFKRSQLYKFSLIFNKLLEKLLGHAGNWYISFKKSVMLQIILLVQNSNQHWGFFDWEFSIVVC